MPSIHPSYTWYLNEADQFDVDYELTRLFNEASQRQQQRELQRIILHQEETKIVAKKSGFAKFVRKIEGSS